MTLVRGGPQAAALHALVVGVGNYPNLTNPSLGSASRSALTFASWLADEFGHPDLGLGSIELLVTDPNGEAVDWKGQPIAPATVQNLINAIGSPASPGWYHRASSAEENIALVYFCGHGLEKGLRSSLLLEGFDPKGFSPFADAIDVEELIGGMESCLARQQLFIFDACRDTPSWLLAHLGPMGQTFVRRDLDNRPTAKPRQVSILRSTAAEHQSWGEPQGLSRFTTALLRALDGPAADDRFSDNGVWEIRPESITPTLLRLAEVGALPSWGHNEPRSGGDAGSFVFHVPKNVKVPVRIGCDPLTDNTEALFSIHTGEVEIGSRDVPVPDDWFVDLEPNQVVVKANLHVRQQLKQSAVTRITPPCRKVTIR